MPAGRTCKRFVLSCLVCWFGGLARTLWAGLPFHESGRVTFLMQSVVEWGGVMSGIFGNKKNSLCYFLQILPFRRLRIPEFREILGSSIS